MATPEFDLLVIGGGSAGSTAITNLQDRQLKIALVERDKMGGTCLNYGCDPTKTLLHIAALLHDARHAQKLGLRILDAGFEWSAVLEHVRQGQADIRGGTPEEAERDFKEATLFKGQARFVSPHEVEVNGQRLKAKQIIIATGSKPTVPPIEGLKEAGYITNIEAVSLPTLPRRLAIMGGGPIGIEFAQIFTRFGVEVTVVEKSADLLDTEDRDLADRLVELLAKEGVSFKAGVEVVRVHQDAAGKRLTLQNKHGQQSELVADEILVAVGRAPALDGLDLEAAGVETTERGVRVDEYLRTNVPHIWAAGDIASPFQFTHVADEQGKRAALNAFAASPEPYDDKIIPWGIYTYPSIADVGQTEQELREAGQDFVSVLHTFEEVARAVTDDQTSGMVKLLASREGKILGGHALANDAGDLLSPVVLAMRSGLTIKTLAHTVQPYPTLAEAIMQAADQLQKKL